MSKFVIQTPKAMVGDTVEILDRTCDFYGHLGNVMHVTKGIFGLWYLVKVSDNTLWYAEKDISKETVEDFNLEFII